MKRVLVVLIVAGAFVAGRYWKAAPQAQAKAERQPLYWHDPMHPSYKSDKPGIAPDCNMPLTPVYAEDLAATAEAAPAGTVQVSADKQQLIGVQYGIVEMRPAVETVRASAKVAMDETRIAKVQSRIEGWIDDVKVDFTGKQVRKGEPLLTIYSPEAMATQQEYLLALKARRQMENNPIHEMATSSVSLLEAARRRMQLWEITDAQIDEVEKTGKPLKNLTLYAPVNGFVIERNAFAKQRVTADTVLYTLADLSSVWVIADVFEYEGAAIRLGQHATMTLSYFPGKTFAGVVSNVLPQVDPMTRTIKVRLQFANPGFQLKPEMYGNVEFRTGGGMKLMVANGAVMNSGMRQVVFVDRGNGNFEPRVVKVGQQVDGRTEILSGLKAGERIVTSGNFLLDSESQLQGAGGGGK